MWLTRLSITRPVTILMVVATMVIMGFQARSRLPVDLYPDVSFPMLYISTVYPGTGPEEIETLVTKPIEDQLSTISGLEKLTSTSYEGVSQVMLQFELKTDINDVAADVRSKLDALRSRLPQDIRAPVVQKIDIGAIPVIQLHVASTERSSIEVRRLADDVLKDRLSQVTGVASVMINGGEVREIKVQVDKHRLEAYGISINQVVNALAADNINLPSGTVKEEERNYAVRVLGEFSSIDDIRNLRIPTPGNRDLRMHQIAEVKDTVADQTVLTRLDGGPSVSVTVQKQSGSNTIEVVDGVRETLEMLTGKPFTEAHEKAAKKAEERKQDYLLDTGVAPIIPADIEITSSFDQSEFVKEALNDVYKALFEGALLAVLIVFLFLHSLRGTFIVSLAIPTSMISAFMVMELLDFSINMMSMLGLSLAVGILVDDSIVVLENIHRHLKMGKSPREAAIAGRTEIGLAAITITMVDVVVFVPIAFLEGIIGQFFRQFGIVVATATLFSLFVSFTLAPMLASRWLKPHDAEEEAEARQAERPGLFWRFTQVWETAYHHLEGLYRSLLAWSLDHRAAVFCLGFMVFVGALGTTLDNTKGLTPEFLRSASVLLIALFVLALIGSLMAGKKGSERTKSTPPAPVMFGAMVLLAIFILVVPTRLRSEFFPATDDRQFTVSIEEAVGTPLAVTDRTTRLIEEQLRDAKLYPETSTISAVVGGTSGGGMSAGSSGADIAELSVELHDRTSRTRSTDAVVKDVNTRFAKLPGVKVTAKLPASGPGGDPISIEISGTDIARTQQVAQEIADVVENTEGTFSTELSWRSGRPEFQARIDRERAAQYGLSVAQIASTLRTSMEGNTSAKYREGGKEYDIRVALPEEQRHLISQMANMVVGNTAAGRAVYLYEVVDMKHADGPTKVDRSNRQRAVTVTAQLTQDTDIGTVQRKMQPKLDAIDTSGVQVNWAGQAKEMQESFAEMGSALMLSIVLVFILMAALFESFLSPLIIGLSVPQALAGALVALTLTDKSISIPSLIGIIMLVGLVTKNAILLVDYTNTLRHEHGMSRRDALMTAGPIRLRPILMTTFAMIFGMLPTALAFSEGSEWRQPMAIAVIGGLLLSMFLTLLMVPAFYEVMDSLGEWFTKQKEALVEKTHM